MDQVSPLQDLFRNKKEEFHVNTMEKEMDFSIGLILRTKLISLPSYKMALAMLKKLKTHL